jgi:hypothetical protein
MEMINREVIACCESIVREEQYQVFLSRWQSAARRGVPVPIEENEVRRILRYYDKCLELVGLLLGQKDSDGLRGTLRLARRVAGAVGACSFLAIWAKEVGQHTMYAVETERVRDLVQLRRHIQGVVDSILSAHRRQLDLLEVGVNDGER